MRVNRNDADGVFVVFCDRVFPAGCVASRQGGLFRLLRTRGMMVSFTSATVRRDASRGPPCVSAGGAGTIAGDIQLSIQAQNQRERMERQAWWLELLLTIGALLGMLGEHCTQLEVRQQRTRLLRVGGTGWRRCNGRMCLCDWQQPGTPENEAALASRSLPGMHSLTHLTQIGSYVVTHPTRISSSLTEQRIAGCYARAGPDWAGSTPRAVKSSSDADR
jgi:hypothetical protein